MITPHIYKHPRRSKSTILDKLSLDYTLTTSRKNVQRSSRPWYKRNLVEILRFRHFSRHVVFDSEGDKFRNKRIEDYITVSVVIDMGCGNTKN